MRVERVYPEAVRLVEGDEMNFYNLRFLSVAPPDEYERVFGLQLHSAKGFVCLQYQQLELNELKMIFKLGV